MPNGEGGAIVIKGGSVSLQYDANVYVRDPTLLNTYNNPNQRIRQIRIVSPNGTDEYDSGDHPEGLMFSIYVMCR